MVGRKISTAAVVGALATVTLMGGCRDEASTGPSDVPAKDFAANLVLQTGDDQTGAVALALPVQLAVKVTDAGGNPVPDAEVNWVVRGGGGFVNPPTGVSDASGFVRTRWTLGEGLGENLVRAYLTNGFVIDSVDFKATAINGEAVIIKVTASTRPAATVPVATTLTPIEFTITDEFGHPVPNATVNFTVGPNSGSADPATGVTDENGKVSTIWTTGTVTGPQTISASIPGQLPVTTTITATPDTSRRITVVSGDNQVGLVNTTRAAPVTVRVTDRFGNPTTGDVVTFTDSIGSGNVMFPATTTTDASGLASASWTVGALAGPQRIRVRTPGSGGQVARFVTTSQVQFRDVFAGNYYTCAVSTGDVTYCWGFGLDGQLGNAARISRNAPNWPVTNADSILGPYPNFRTVSGGPSHACGITLTSSLNCWGFSPDGRAFITPGSPFAIPTTPVVSSVRFLATGESFSCYVTAAALAVCNGSNELFEATGVNNIPPATGYSTIAAGLRHGCGMPRFDPANTTVSRIPQCWGENNNGQLGRDTATFLPSPAAVPVTMPAGVTFDSLSIVAGAAHTCGLATADSPTPGVAYCWGSNAFGQLGNGAAIVQGGRSAVPVAVAGVAFARLYGGDYHTCGLTAAGAAFCWGRNTSGQLGDGTMTSVSAPVAVGGGLSFRSLSLGELHTCGVTGAGPVLSGTTSTPGDVYCWGDNEKGQLGNGTFGANGVPVLGPARVTFQQ